MYDQLLKSPLVINRGGDLVQHLNDYITGLDENPLKGNARFNEDKGEVIYPPVPNPGCVTGFCLHLGMQTGAFVALRDSYPEEFDQCIETLRRRLLKKAVNKRFAKLVAARPLLDLSTNTTCLQNKALRP